MIDTVQDLTAIFVVVMCLGYVLWWAGTWGGRR